MLRLHVDDPGKTEETIMITEAARQSWRLSSDGVDGCVTSVKNLFVMNRPSLWEDHCITRGVIDVGKDRLNHGSLVR